MEYPQLTFKKKKKKKKGKVHINGEQSRCSAFFLFHEDEKPVRADANRTGARRPDVSTCPAPSHTRRLHGALQ
jgi:hypothetical protein